MFFFLNTQKVARTQTQHKDGHCDLETDSAQWGNSVKKSYEQTNNKIK